MLPREVEAQEAKPAASVAVYIPRGILGGKDERARREFGDRGAAHVLIDLVERIQDRGERAALAF